MKAGLLWIAVPLLFGQDGGVIEGTASNKVTHAGVGGVTIGLAAQSAPDNQLYVARSDAAGAFRIDGVKEGDYVASFEAPTGFLAPAFWDPWCKPFHIAAACGITRLDVPIAPLGSLRGRVVDAGGAPVPRVRVELFRVHAHAGHILTTDADGRFAVQGGLVPGAYQLRARPALAGTLLGQRPEGVTPLPTQPPEGERWMWAPTYFPNAVEISGAMTIAVREGSDLSGYEIRLRAAPVYRLRGVVLDEEGKPAAGVALYLLSEIGWGTADALVKSSEDGSFEFPAVRAGEWRMAAETKRGKTDWKGSTKLAMPKHDVEDTVVRIAPPFTLDGVVEGTPQPETSKTRLIVSLSPVADGEAPHSLEQSDGTLHFEDVYPGNYRVGQYAEIPGYYLKSILLGTQDVTGQDVYLTHDSPAIRVVYKAGAARAHGTVEDGAGVKVVLIQADQERYVPGESLRAAVCDREGRFTMEGLRPIVYYAFAFAIGNVESGAVTEMVFARGLDRKARVLQLSEGETATVNLKKIPWPE